MPKDLFKWDSGQKNSFDEILLDSTNKDVRIYRASANVLATDDSFQTIGHLYFAAGTVINWGDGLGGFDVNLYRNATNELKTDDSFTVMGNFVGAGNLYAYSSTSKLWFGDGAGTFDIDLYRHAAGHLRTSGSIIADQWLYTSAGYLILGADVNLYRSGEHVLKTDDNFYAVGWLGCNSHLYLDNSWANIFWGNGAGGYDVNLYRLSANTLMTDDDFRTASNIYIANSSGTLYFGNPADVSLYRAGADVLKTDDYFQVNNSIALWGDIYLVTASKAIYFGDSGGGYDIGIYRKTAGELGVGGILSTVDSESVAGAVDKYCAAIGFNPTYTGSGTINRHNYMVMANPALSGVTLTDACIIRFDANAGTHKAVDGGSTKGTPGGVNAWVKINVNGTIYYMPAYTSKTS